MGYATVFDTIANLQQRGFVCDFKCRDDGLYCTDAKQLYPLIDVVVMERYAYHPPGSGSCEVVVYAIQTGNGLQGICFGHKGEELEHSGAEPKKY